MRKPATLLLFVAMLGLGLSLLRRELPEQPDSGAGVERVATAGADRHAVDGTRATVAGGPDPAPAPTSDRMPRQTPALAARTASELLALTGRDLGRMSHDARMSYVMAMDHCDHPAFGDRRVRPETIIRHLESKGESARAAHARHARSAFCDTVLPFDDARWLGQLREDRSADARALADAVAADLVEVPPDAAAAIARIRQALATTDSFFDYLEISHLLASHPLSVQLFEPTGVSRPDLTSGNAAAAISWAACSIFGGCEAHGLLALQTCLGVCDRPTSLMERLHDNLSPRERRAVEPMVHWLLALRRSG